MKFKFYKYHGNGNDFIFFDNRDGSIELTEDQIIRLCHRRFGIGSDGIVLIEEHDKCDFDMVFYNPDASQSFCGNGSRCALHFANFLGIISGTYTFNAIDGIHEGKYDNGISSVHMHDVSDVEKGEDYYYLNTGSPHYVKFVEDIESIDVYSEGKKIRHNDRFKDVGTNVNFVQLSNTTVKSRVYERGVENETFSSGTGTTAVALSAYLKNPQLGEKIIVDTKGGNIKVSFTYKDGNFSDVWLEGKVEQVFSGDISI